ncbi:hypothetical protein HMPREF9069_01897 [Atopobium sp. oral taxon 810 str. F0209]|nr:hypothetical protein HMPREF9069_01897 [Atopobium sp. oral taxon 810 str. F0209]
MKFPYWVPWMQGHVSDAVWGARKLEVILHVCTLTMLGYH